MPTTTTTYYLRAEGNAGPCSGSTTAITAQVTVNAVPSGVVASNTGPYVVGQTISLSVTPTGLSSYQWSAADGFTASGQTTTRSGATLAMSEAYTVTLTNATGCTATASTNVVVQAAIIYTWQGGSNDWATGSNWAPQVVGGPNNCAASVIIPNTSHQPVINTVVSVGDVTMNNGAQLTINSGFSLSSCGDITGGSTGTPPQVLGQGVFIMDGTTDPQKINGYVRFAELVINNSFGVQMQRSSSLDVYTALDLQAGTFDATLGAMTFKSTSTSSIAILDNFSPGYGGTITGNVNAERYYTTPTANSYEQHMMGSPVNTPALSQLGASGTSGYVTPMADCDETLLSHSSLYGNVFSYHESNGQSCELAQWMVEASGNAENGLGYSVVRHGTGTLTINGQANLTDVQVQNLTNTNGWTNTSHQGRPYESGWQLLANPYQATIVIDPSINSASFDDQVHVWNANTASYVTTNTIAPFQAFMVHKSTAGGTASYTIKASERVRTPATFYQQSANELTLVATNNTLGSTDQATIAFNSSATDTFDARYDANKLAGALNRHTIYSVNNGKWMGRNVLHDIATTSTVPVGFEPGNTATFNLAFNGVNTFDPTSYIYLEDKALNIMHDARSGDYSFAADSAEGWNRFVVHFTPPAQITTLDATCTTGGTINIQQPGTANWNYTLTDSSNAIVTSGVLNQSQSITVNVATGYYTLTLTDTNGYVAVKSILVNGPQLVAASFMKSADTVQVQQNVVLSSTSTGATAYTWNLGNGTVATGQTVNVSYSQPGVYLLSLEVTNDAGCSSTQTQTITVTPAATTGLNNLNGTGGLKIWSHDDKVYVDFTALQKVDATVIIYNILGQEISNEKVSNNVLYQKEVDNVDAAYFVVMVKNEDQISTKKVFITNNK